ncbi:MAG TPA: glycosyltransferase family 4 protein [Saprospiraceae bacterium]|nr:glycosyltransferase family 4 protein [Saprospiraceae bacterium]HNG89659.1 glycosyltransferase family 4 protein [Saprospiraceae bacterium]
MKILQLCNKFPYPLKDGAAIAITYLAKAFAELGHEVTLLSMNTSKHWFDLAHLPHDYDHYARMHTVYVDNRILPWPALRNLFTGKSYHIQRFDNAAFAEKLIHVLQQDHFDVVQLESLYLTPYLPVIRQHAPQARVVLRAHNVEHEIWERVAENSNPLKKWYLRRITPRLKQYEVEHLNDYDLVAAISARDAEHLRRLGLQRPVVVTPIGLDVGRYQPDYSSYECPLSLSFIGSLDWMPNQEGLWWFLEQVWTPVLAPAFPGLTFHIAGRTAPKWLRELRIERVTYHGEVPNAADFLKRHAVMVVPLLSGGGMRAKILEGMAVGQVVLSTRLGMEGIAARHGQECLLADTPQEMLEALRWCIQQGAALADMGRRAAAFCASHYDNLQVAQRLIEVWEDAPCAA